MGLVLTSRALPFVSARLDSLCTSTSPFPPDTLDYSARAHFLSTQSARCQSLPDYTLQIHEFLSPFFLYITNTFTSSFILSTDRLSRVIKRDEPKGSPPSLTSFPIPLLFSQFASQYSKNLVPHYSTPVVQRIPLYLNSFVVPESLVLLSVSP